MDKRKVLIVDDSDMNRAVLADILGSGYEFAEAGDGSEAVEFLRGHGDEAALVLLDVVMPGSGGFAVLEYMGRDGLSGRVPVLMVSAQADPESINRAFDLGAADFIPRPFDALLLRRRAERAIELFDRLNPRGA